MFMLPPPDGACPAPTAQSGEATISKPKSQSQAELQEADDHNSLDPLIDAMLDHLPAPGDVFEPEQRKLWLQILELAFKLIYLEQEEEPVGEQQHGGGDV